MDKTLQCPDCKGSGKRSMQIGLKTQEYGCGLCLGKGVVKRCPSCKGKGMVKGKYCPDCAFRFGLVPV